MSEKNGEINTAFIDNLGDFIAELHSFEPRIEKVYKLKKVTESDKFLLWYRGQTDSTKPMIPNIYRKLLSEDDRDPKKFWIDLKEKEQFYLRDFKIRNYDMIERLPENNLFWMSIMQHHGTPTRLLDWSENAMSALFFALEDYFSTERKYENLLPCVWCLKPIDLASHAKRHHRLDFPDRSLPDMISLLLPSQPGYLQNEPCDSLKYTFLSYEFNGSSSSTKCYPIPLIPPYNNDRIRAQSGAFCLFPIQIYGEVCSASDVALENLPGADQFLKCIILLKPAQISYELKALGIKRSMFYPEMPSSSYDIEQELNLHLR